MPAVEFRMEKAAMGAVRDETAGQEVPAVELGREKAAVGAVGDETACQED